MPAVAGGTAHVREERAIAATHRVLLEAGPGGGGAARARRRAPRRTAQLGLTAGARTFWARRAAAHAARITRARAA